MLGFKFQYFQRVEILSQPEPRAPRSLYTCAARLIAAGALLTNCAPHALARARTRAHTGLTQGW